MGTCHRDCSHASTGKMHARRFVPSHLWLMRLGESALFGPLGFPFPFPFAFFLTCHGGIRSSCPSSMFHSWPTRSRCLLASLLFCSLTSACPCLFLCHLQMLLHWQPCKRCCGRLDVRLCNSQSSLLLCLSLFIRNLSRSRRFLQQLLWHPCGSSDACPLVALCPSGWPSRRARCPSG